MNFPPDAYLDLSRTAHRKLFDEIANAWEALPQIAAYLRFRLKPAMKGRLIGRPHIGANVYIGEGTVVEPGATIKGPAWIGDGCEIRSGCYIRENVIVGSGAVLGNSCEFKNCILFDEAQVPHFNYVGDSILGHKAHLGAGVILSNVRLDHAPVTLHTPEGTVATGLRKFGALIGDRAEIGCNAVLSPGSIIGRDALVYPTLHWRGILPEGHIARVRTECQILPRQKR